VDAATEAQVLIIPSLGIEVLRISTPRCEDEDDGRALRNDRIGNLDIGEGGAQAELDWWVVAQYLLDVSDHQCRVVAQPFEDVRMT